MALRAVLSSIFIALLTSTGSLTALLVRAFDPSGNRVLDLARWWSRVVTRFAGVQIQVVQRAALSPERAYVFMANHLSALDIWALFVALPIRVRMIAKKQLGWIPLFGWAMRAGRFMFIDRKNAVAARRTIDEAARRIGGGESVLLFPEGTRSRDGSLGPFKKGGIHLAIAAEVPIVPVAIRGTRELMPRGSLLLRGGKVSVTIGELIPTAGLSVEDRNQLVERVRAAIAEMLATEPREERRA
jgi:1-acyl-sn-glycerol-3-phosphate acyltransferase